MGSELLSDDDVMMVVVVMQVTHGSTPGMEAAGVSLALTLTAKVQMIALVILCPWILMVTESLSEDDVMMVTDLMQVTHASTPGMEAAGVSLALILMGKQRAIILVTLCP